MDITIRAEREKDYPRITEVNDLAFAGPAEGQLIEKLRRTLNFLPELSLVVEADGVLVGHILFLVAAIVTETARVSTLALELLPGALKEKSGVVEYPKEFQGV